MNFNKKNINRILVAIGILLIVSVVVIYVGIKTNFITGKADLKWAENKEKSLAGYKVYFGTEPRKGNTSSDSGYTDSVDVGLNNNFSFKKLSVNKTYYFSITAYNKVGKESGFSAEVKKKITLKDVFKK